MKIWLINHYAVPPKYYPLARQNYFARYLMEMGHEVTIIAASSVHHSDINLITDGSLYKEIDDEGVHYVLIGCKQYKGNGKSRILNMMEFARKLPKVCDKLEKPDAIVSTSLTPMACAKGIKLAKKYGCRAIAEIADLWPESLIAYGIAGKSNPAVLVLRRLEKWIYTHADGVIFTMEGAYDYIIEQGWEKAVPRTKVFHINNGVNLADFDFNKEKYLCENAELNDEKKFVIAHVGAIGQANNVSFLLDTAKLVKNPNIRFQIWGNGPQEEELRKRCTDEHINNVSFMGRVEKRYVPGIVSKADANCFMLGDNPLYRFGLSLNKSFEYLAAGRPVLMFGKAGYSMLDRYNCGIQVQKLDPGQAAKAIESIANLPKEQYEKYCKNARNAAYEYDFKKHTEKLYQVIMGKAQHI